jgi:response regulator of citrate/malate metabolism
MGVNRMIRSGTINMIREKAQKGKSAYAIGKELGISKNTAKKYMSQPKAEHGLKGGIRVVPPADIPEMNNLAKGKTGD